MLYGHSGVGSSIPSQASLWITHICFNLSSWNCINSLFRLTTVVIGLMKTD